MKKLVLLTLAAIVVAGSAFAAAPVTKISDGSTKVQADYAFKQHVSKGGGNSNDGFGVSLQHDLSDKTAVQYSFDKLNAKNGDIKDKYSWWSYRANARANNVGWRIDYFFISQDLSSKVKDAYILDSVTGSDHAPVVLEIDL